LSRDFLVDDGSFPLSPVSGNGESFSRRDSLLCV
jgi:hypothetical protein